MIIILISELSVIFLLFIRSSGFGRQDSVVSSQETGDRRQETGDRRQETGDRRQETGDRRQET
ncbi:hypothetical protein, partial [Microcystis aeruginosa]|uniref:hypothetical protein n=1 Tax=Microcystis aeruginosa TaxID=1126 RepID=UPI001C0ECF0A